MFSDKPQMQESDTEPQELEESRDVRRRQNAAVRDRYGLGDSVTSDRFVLEESDSEWLSKFLSYGRSKSSVRLWPISG